MKIMMDNKEARRVAIIEPTLEGKFKNYQAAQLLELSVRQVKRLKKIAKVKGSAAVLHANRGKQPHNALPAAKQAEILQLATSKLKNCNYLHMQEVLETEMGIEISYSSLYRLMRSHHIETSMPKRRRRCHRSRKAMNHFGELVQLDASKFDWFSDGSYAYLHAAIDDATNKVLALYFTKEESLEGYRELIFQINKAYGLPHTLYADGRTIFFYDSKLKHKLSLEEQLAGIEENRPQFARACKSTGITLMHAYSPQAKGLVERLWGSFQNRLPKDFLRLDIRTMDQANAYFSRFIPSWNRRHSHDPAAEESFFAPKWPSGLLELHFATQEKRILSKGFTFAFQGKKYTIPDPSCPAHPGDILTVAFSESCPVQVIFEGQAYKVIEFKKSAPLAPVTKLTAEELTKKRSEYGRMGRQASPFRKTLPQLPQSS
jgi:transposase